MTNEEMETIVRDAVNQMGLSHIEFKFLLGEDGGWVAGFIVDGESISVSRKIHFRVEKESTPDAIRAQVTRLIQAELPEWQRAVHQ